MEFALLSLHATSNPEEFGAEQVSQLELRQGVDLQAPEDALSTAAAVADSESTVDRFAAAQAMHLGVKLERERGGLETPLGELGVALLRSVGANAARVAGAERAPADILIDTLLRLSPDEGITDEAVDDLVSAFGPRLQRNGSVATNDLELSGAAAWLVMLLLEFFTNGLKCTNRIGEEMVGGVKKPVMFVEVDVCTNQPFSHCKVGINPLQWPSCNPYFLSVHTIGPVTRTGDGWAGVIQESVGCPFNGLVYVTDLAVTMIEQARISIVAFELAPHRTDPGLVSVDRGFLSATDEGTHRRIRVLKVYRIENLDLPHNWVCPLWASQVAMAAWWRS